MYLLITQTQGFQSQSFNWQCRWPLTSAIKKGWKEDTQQQTGIFNKDRLRHTQTSGQIWVMIRWTQTDLMTADYLLVFQILSFVHVARDHINRESMLRRQCCDGRPAGLFWMITDYQRALLASSETFTKSAFLLLKSKLNWLKGTHPNQWWPWWYRGAKQEEEPR